MNKHCFRLIFSKPLGFLIPVAEITTAQRKPGQQRTPCLPPTPPAFSLKRIVLSLLLATTPGWAAAEILLDRNFGGTSVGSAANGVPVIEIANLNLKSQRFRMSPGMKSGNLSQASISSCVSSLICRRTRAM